MDICPERMDAADAEAPRPPRIDATMLSLETAVDICPEKVDTVEEFGKIETVEDAEASRLPWIEMAVGFWSWMRVETEVEHSKKKKKQKQEAAGECEC